MKLFMKRPRLDASDSAAGFSIITLALVTGMLLAACDISKKPVAGPPEGDQPLTRDGLYLMPSHGKAIGLRIQRESDYTQEKDSLNPNAQESDISAGISVSDELILQYTVDDLVPEKNSTLGRGVMVLSSVKVRGVDVPSCEGRVACPEAGLYNPNAIRGSIAFKPISSMLGQSTDQLPAISFAISAADSPKNQDGSYQGTLPNAVARLNVEIKPPVSLSIVPHPSNPSGIQYLDRIVFQLTGGGFTAADTVSYDCDVLPTGLSRDGATISGVVSSIGSQEISCSATSGSKTATRSATISVSKRALGASAQIAGKTYDGTRAVDLLDTTGNSCSFSFTRAPSGNQNATPPACHLTSAQFDDKVAGSQKSVAVGTAVSSDVSDLYDVPSTTQAHGDITKAFVQVTAAVTLTEKTYDGSTAMASGQEMTVSIVGGKLEGDALEASCQDASPYAPPSYNSANVAEADLVSCPAKLSGADSSNYMVASSASYADGFFKASASIIPSKRQTPAVLSHAPGLYNTAITPTFTGVELAVSTDGSAPDCGAARYTPSSVAVDKTFKVVSCAADSNHEASDVLTVGYLFNIITPRGVVFLPNVDSYPEISWDSSIALDIEKEGHLVTFGRAGGTDQWLDHAWWHNSNPSNAGRVITKIPLGLNYLKYLPSNFSLGDAYTMTMDSVFCPNSVCYDSNTDHSVKIGSFKKEFPASFATETTSWTGKFTEVDSVSAPCVLDPCIYHTEGLVISRVHIGSGTWEQIAHTYYGQSFNALSFDAAHKRLIVGGQFTQFWNAAWSSPWEPAYVSGASGLIVINTDDRSTVTVPLTPGEGVLSDNPAWFRVMSLAIDGDDVYLGINVPAEDEGRVVRATIPNQTVSPGVTVSTVLTGLKYPTVSINSDTKTLQASHWGTATHAPYCRVDTSSQSYASVCVGGASGIVYSKGGKDYVGGNFDTGGNWPGFGIYEMTTIQVDGQSAIKAVRLVDTFGSWPNFLKTDSGSFYVFFDGPVSGQGQSYLGRVLRFDPETVGETVSYHVASDLDGGVGVSNIGNGSSISSLQAFSQGGSVKIFAAGFFSKAGRDTQARSVAVYDETSNRWDAMREHKDLVGAVRAQSVDTSSAGCSVASPCVYVAGDITAAPSTEIDNILFQDRIPVHGVARFQSGVWTDMNPGTDACLTAAVRVTAMAVDRTAPAAPRLLVGGNIEVGQETSYRVCARSLAASGSSTFGSVMTGQGELRGLALAGGNLVAAGSFGVKVSSLSGGAMVAEDTSLNVLSLALDDGGSQPAIYVGLAAGSVKRVTLGDTSLTLEDAFSASGDGSLTGDVLALAVDETHGIVMASVRDISGIHPCICMVSGSEASNLLMEYKNGSWGAARLMAGRSTIPVYNYSRAGEAFLRPFEGSGVFEWRTTPGDPNLSDQRFNFNIRMAPAPNTDWSAGAGPWDFDLDKTWPAEINSLAIGRDQSSGCSEQDPCVYVGGRFHYVHGKIRPNFVKYMTLFKEVL